MEPTKFEEHSREKFEERELQPSATAWDSLEKMLDAEVPTKKKSGFPWFAIAASFIGLVIIASIVFNTSGSIGSPDFVEETTPKELLKTKEVLPQESKQIQAQEKQEEGIATSNEPTNNVESSQEMLQPKRAVTQYNASEKTKVASSKASLNKKQTIPNKQQQKSTSITFQKPKDAIAYDASVTKEITTPNISEKQTNATSHKIITSGEKAVAEAETKKATDIDALLKEAQNKLKENSDLKTQKVDALALLGDIELSREQSLRTKVIYALGEGLEYVKSSVVASGNQ